MNSEAAPAACTWTDPASLSRKLSDVERHDFGEIFADAVALMRQEGRLSLDSLQRHFGIGHCRAIRVADAMERLGLTPPQIIARHRARARWRVLIA